MKESTKKIIEVMKEDDVLSGAFLELAYLCHEEKDKAHVGQCAYAFFKSLEITDKLTALAVSLGIERALSEVLEEDENDGEND